jgi:hypothetical protein
MKRTVLLFLIPVMILFLPGMVFGHGVEVSELSAPEALAVAFMYSTGEPMAFVDIKVYPPSSPKDAMIESYTDRNGRFIFIPDEVGEWNVEAADGMGHFGNIVVQAGSDSSGVTVAGNSGGKLPLAASVLLGLSLIANVFALYYLVLKKIPHKEATGAY